MTYRLIPSIEHLRQLEDVRRLEEQFGRDAVIEALREEAAAVRSRIAIGEVPGDVTTAIVGALAARVRGLAAPALVRVVNATGVIVHTNLGRAPLSAAASARAAALAAGYANLEYDLQQGARGRRDVHAERLLCRLTGAAAAVVVNNNAAAALLTLSALAAGREVLISRGELVEIGGGFRVPDVMTQSGALLREVGTTNRTRTADYAAAISDATALILRVHPSNFRIEGFAERPGLTDLVALAKRFTIPIVEDLGSGYLGVPAGIGALRSEPAVAASIAAGVDVVTFSGDKLLGGPQAGIIAGTDPALARIRRHPLMRALRVDKLTYAALEATLESYAAGRAVDEIPVARMIALPAEAVDARARRVAAALPDSLDARVSDGHSTIGGGSAPGSLIPTRLLTVRHRRIGCDALAARLRAGDPPIITRIEEDRVVFDLRTVAPEDDPVVIDALHAVG